MRFFIVDAFTTSLFGGNPAGVALLDSGADFPPDLLMQKTAAELRYSETAFVAPRGPGSFETRYFTPEGEVDLCGHATIGAFSVLAWEGLVREGDWVNNRTKAGELGVRIARDHVMMDMAPPQVLGLLDDREAREDLYRIMGLPPENVEAWDLLGSRQVLLPAAVSTGLPDMLLPVSTPELLSSLQPDMDALSAWSKDRELVGVHAFALGGPKGPCIAYCRNFAPLYGIPEEAATGTSNGALTYYLYSRHLIPAGEPVRFIQGREMDRPSLVIGLVETAGETVSIKVGGSAVLLAKGEIFIGE